MTVYYVDGAVGNDANAGTSEGSGNAWATIQKAADTVAAGDTVYVKATGTYSEDVSIATAGTSSAFIIWIGYTSSTADEGKVTISATTNAVTNLVYPYQSWRNFIFTGGSSHGFNGGSLIDQHTFYNCDFTNNGGSGIAGDNTFLFVNCTFTNNTLNGIDVDSQNLIVGCILSGNGGSATAASTTNTTYYKCVFFNNSTTADVVPGGVYNFIGNTIDGDGTSGDGLGSAITGYVVADNIFHDIGTDGVRNNINGTPYMYVGNNLFSSITGSNYTNDPAAYGLITGYQDVTGAPAFTDEAGDDYRVRQDSPAVGAGVVPGGIT